MHTLLKQATVSWKEESISGNTIDSSPRSLDFDDLYFTGNFDKEDSSSTSSAKSAVEHIFFKPNNLEERFNQVKESETISILETGFGSGLNFFLCFDKWQKRAGANSGILRFISTELYPLTKKDFKKFGESRDFIDSKAFDFILKNYPPNIQGQYSFYFPKERVQLVLLLGDALLSLKNLDLKVDCIFLDGFSPSQNKELWSKELCHELGRLSKVTSTLSSFTVAGWVRRNLEEAGFKVQKITGFPPKKHSLKAVRAGFQDTKTKKVPQKLFPSKKAIIIGAGFSGCALAYSLSKYGIKSVILEKANEIAQGASGNRLAIAAPYLSNQQNFLNEFNFLSLEYFFNLVSSLKEENKKLEFSHQGALQLLSRKRLIRIFEEKYLEKYSNSILEILNKESIKDRFNFASSTEGFFLKRAGYINPQNYCNALVRSSGSKLIFNAAVKEIEKRKNTWLALDAEQNIIAEADFMILANAYSVNDFSQTNFLSLEPIRGQVTSFKALKCLENLKNIVCFDGYLTPSVNGQHFLGATYAHDDLEPDVRNSDNENMLSSLTKYLPSLPLSELPSKEELLKNSRVSFRASTYDRAPFVGEIPGEENLFVSAGFGSRGLSTSSLSAEIVSEEIVSKIRGEEVSTFPSSIKDKLSPARYFKSRKYRREVEA